MALDAPCGGVVERRRVPACDRMALGTALEVERTELHRVLRFVAIDATRREPDAPVVRRGVARLAGRSRVRRSELRSVDEPALPGLEVVARRAVAAIRVLLGVTDRAGTGLRLAEVACEAAAHGRRVDLVAIVAVRRVAPGALGDVRCEVRLVGEREELGLTSSGPLVQIRVTVATVCELTHGGLTRRRDDGRGGPRLRGVSEAPQEEEEAHCEPGDEEGREDPPIWSPRHTPHRSPRSLEDLGRSSFTGPPDRRVERPLTGVSRLPGRPARGLSAEPLLDRSSRPPAPDRIGPGQRACPRRPPPSRAPSTSRPTTARTGRSFGSPTGPRRRPLW